MMHTPVGFITTLASKYLKTDINLPIPNEDLATLISLLNISTNDFVYLTITDEISLEVIKVSGGCGSLVVERGIDGTNPQTFPKGSCVSFRITPAIVKELICTHKCCVDECCVPVTVALGTLANGNVGVPYLSSIIFNGSTPMSIAVSNAAPWMSVTTGSNHVSFQGIPSVPGNYTISIAATNCHNDLVTTASTITIT